MRDRLPRATIQSQFAKPHLASASTDHVRARACLEQRVELGTLSGDADSLSIARSVKVFAMREVNEALEHLPKNHGRYRAVLVNDS